MADEDFFSPLPSDRRVEGEIVFRGRGLSTGMRDSTLTTEGERRAVFWGMGVGWPVGAFESELTLGDAQRRFEADLIWTFCLGSGCGAFLMTYLIDASKLIR